MKKNVFAATLTSFVLAFLPGSASAQLYYLTDTLWIRVTFYDYRSDGTNPNFEVGSCGRKPDLVMDTLDSDRKPVLQKSLKQCPTDRMQEWFRPIPDPAGAYDPWTNTWENLVPYKNRVGEFVDPSYDSLYDMATIVVYDSLPFILVDSTIGLYEFYRDNQDQFFRLDGRGFGAEGFEHNYSFTMELHHKGIYQGGEYFDFRGDDDVWGFINGKKVLDLGGTGAEVRGSFSLDELAANYPELNLKIGRPYHFDFFYTERKTTQSNIGIMTNILTPTPLDSIVLHVEPNDTIPAGDTVMAWAEVFNDTGGVQTQFGDAVSWNLVESGGNHDSTLSSKTGDTVYFVPTEAYSYVTLEGVLLDSATGRYLRDSLRIYVLPGDPHHVVVESTSTMTPASLVDDSPIDTLVVPADLSGKEVFAVLRDRFGNFVSYSQNTDWSILNGDVIKTIIGHDGAVGRGSVMKYGHSGLGSARAYDRDYLFSDAFSVKVLNEGPTANDDVYNVPEDHTLTVPSLGKPVVLDNDTDPDANAVLTAQLVETVDHGALNFNADGSFTYVPPSDFTGTVEFSYRAGDGELWSAPAVVTIVVGLENDPPRAYADTVRGEEDAVMTFPAPGVLVNDTDIDSDSLEAVLVSSVPAYAGVLQLSTDGGFVFTPAPDYYGTTSFTYQAYDGYVYSEVVGVTLVIDPVNDAPVAANDAYAVSEDHTLAVARSGGVLSNDYDVDDTTLTAELLTDSNTLSGVLRFNSDGSFTFTPEKNYNGTVEFEYQVVDMGGLADTAKVTIRVDAVNDAPVAVNDVYRTPEDEVLIVDAATGVLANDYDVDDTSLTAVLVEDVDGSKGTLTLGSDGSFTFAPAPNYNGTVVFRYQAYDGSAYSAVATAAISVSPVNDPPVANDDYYTVPEDSSLIVDSADGLLSNDTDPDGDPLTVRLLGTGIPSSQGSLTVGADGAFTFAPTENWTGELSFSYEILDRIPVDSRTLRDTATVTIVVNSGNGVPTAVNDTFTVGEDGVLTVAAPGVLGNDIDPDDSGITASLTKGIPWHTGTLSLSSDGSLTFTPAENYNGSVQAEYRASNRSGNSAPAIIYITVTPVSDRPIAHDDAYVTLEDKKLVVPAPGIRGILANDYDIDGDPLKAVLVEDVDVEAGSLVLDPWTGAFTFIPVPDYFGVTTFSYHVTDGMDNSNPATVTITVAAVNDTPTIAGIPDQKTVRGNPFSDLDLNEYGADVDDHDSVLVWSVKSSSHITATLDPITNLVTFLVADTTWIGSEILTFSVRDEAGASRMRQVTFSVYPPDTLPVPVPNPAPGTITGDSVMVELTVPGHPNAVVWYEYSIDGSRPPKPVPASSDSGTGTARLILSDIPADSTVLRISVYASEYPFEDSEVGRYKYTIRYPQLPKPAASTSSGEHKVAADTISLAVPGHPDAVIRYTLDGSDPKNGTLYTDGEPIVLGPFTRGTAYTLRIFAEKPGYKESRGLYEYDYNPSTLPKPVADPAGHLFVGDSITVSLSIAVGGALIRYTLDGSVPDENSTPYTGPVTITDSTVIRAVGFKDGTVPGPIMKETYVRAVPSKLSIYPSVRADIPYGTTVSCSAGQALPLIGRITDQRGSFLTDFENPEAPISWEMVGVVGTNTGTLTETSGFATSFTPGKAYQSVRLVSVFRSNGIILRDTVVLTVRPGKPYKLWLEADPSKDVSPNRPNPLSTVQMSAGHTVEKVYAVVRDSLGNFIAPSTANAWAPMRSDIAFVQPGRPGLGEGIIYKSSGSGTRLIHGTNGTLNLPYPSDSVAVVVQNYWYDSLRIVVDNNLYSEVDSVILNTNIDTALQVFGRRDDSLNPGWEEVHAKWEILDESLLYRIASPPASAHEYRLSPNDTAEGRIRVTLGDEAKTVPDTVVVRFTPGPATRAEIRIVTPDDSLIAGRPIRAVVELYNADNQPVIGKWCYPMDGDSISFFDDLGRGNKDSVPLVIVDSAVYSFKESASMCFEEQGRDTVVFILYRVPQEDSLNRLNVSLGGTVSSSSGFRLRPAEVSRVQILVNGHPRDTVTMNSNHGEVLRLVGFDIYDNYVGAVAGKWANTPEIPDVAYPYGPQIYYEAVGVRYETIGMIRANALGDSLVADSIHVRVIPPPAVIESIKTMDRDGDGYLDAIQIYFTKTVVLPATMYDSTASDGHLGVSLEVDGKLVIWDILTVVGSPGVRDSVFIIELDENRSYDMPQTAWEPKVTIDDLGPDVGSVTEAITAEDGAGPVVWRVIRIANAGGDRRKDRIVVVFSEDVKAADGGPISYDTDPGEIFHAWEREPDSTVAKESLLQGIDGLTYIVGDTVMFVTSNGVELTSDNLLSLKSGSLGDGRGRPNQVTEGNRPIVVEVIGIVGQIRAGPNPAAPTFNHHQDRLETSMSSEAMQWVRFDGGTVFICDFIVPSEAGLDNGSGDRMTGIMLIYDAIGNLVYKRSNEDDLIPPYQRSRWTPGESRQLVFYWNGITDEGRKSAPGIYRVNLYIKHGKRLQTYKGNIGIAR